MLSHLYKSSRIQEQELSNSSISDLGPIQSIQDRTWDDLGVLLPQNSWLSAP